MVTHRVVAWVAASAVLYACALSVASTRQRDALSPAGVTDRDAGLRELRRHLGRALAA
jgi:hypothetical protein